MKPFDIRFFQDRKKILDLQLNPFTKLYHREKITPTPLSISHVASKHTHTYTQSTKFQILSGVCRISLSCKFHRPISTKQAWKRPTRPRTTTTSHRNLYPSPPDPTRLVHGHKTVGVGTSPRPPRKSSLPSSSSFPPLPSEGKGGGSSVVERVPSEAATRFGSQEDK